VKVEWVYYLDIDLVVGQDLHPWFRQAESTYFQSRTKASVAFFDGNVSPLQGGQFLLRKNNSEDCLLRWRQLMDFHTTEHKDQYSLGIMWDEQQSRKQANCTLMRMPQEPFLSFLDGRAMSRLKQGNHEYPTLMHIKNTDDAKKIPDAIQFEFYENLLGLPSDVVRKHVTGRKRIRPNRTWSEVQVQKRYNGDRRNLATT